VGDRARRQSWFGLKRHVKRFLALRVPNAILRLGARFVPSLRSGRLPAPSRLTEVSGRVGGVSFVMLDPARCENAKALFWGRGRPPVAHDRLALDTVVTLARGSDTFLDVGAYTGLFTLAVTAYAPHVDVHAFEIVPAVADALEANVRRNGIDDRVVVHREGIGDPEKTMQVPSGEGGSALPSFYSSRMQFDGGRAVDFRSLDSVAALIPEAARVVMKVDVESTEDAVFRFGQAFLRTLRPHILCEVLHDVADGAALDGLLAGAMLHKYLVTDTQLTRIDRVVPHPAFRDWLFTPLTEEELRGLGLPVV
jgi:FkbM family methyltransferase